jgi:hypothetical protein
MRPVRRTVAEQLALLARKMDALQAERRPAQGAAEPLALAPPARIFCALAFYAALAMGVVVLLLRLSSAGEVSATASDRATHPAAVQRLNDAFAFSSSGSSSSSSSSSENAPQPLPAVPQPLLLLPPPRSCGGGGGAPEGLALLDTVASLYEYADRAEHLRRLESFSALHATALAPLTVKAQRLLYEWQHPASCAGARFLVSEGNPEGGGLGSHFFVATHHFAMALDMGMVFLWRWNAADDFVDLENCAHAPGIECFVDAPSNCTLQDAFVREEGFKPDTVEVRGGNAGEALGYPDFHYVPLAFQRLWAEAGLPEEEGTETGAKNPRAYWYKTQVVAYLARFNRVTVEALRTQRSLSSNFQTASGPSVPAGHRDAMLALPLPPGTMSAHIRHGDKEAEMRLIPTNIYMDAALRIADMEPLMTSSRNVFVTSEDPSSIEFLSTSLAKVPEYNHWSMAWYSAMPRRDTNGKDQLNAFSDIIAKANLTRLWFLQLTLALECDTWIGTRGSNWNKLIDVLRCVWVPKCQNYMVDVGDNVWRRR